MLQRYLKQRWMLPIWLTVGAFAMAFFAFSPTEHSLSTFFKFGAFTSCMWVFLWMGNEFTSDLVSLKISWTEEPIKRFWAGMAMMVGYTIVIVLILVLIFKYIVDFNVVDDGEDLASILYGSLITTFIISLFMHSRGFLLSWKQAALDAEKSKRESIKAQYESLKNQVNPHFLFNSLNALTNLVYQDPDKAAKFIKQLSDVYRYVLDTRDRELVPAAEELKFVTSYLYLQQIRFGDKLRVQVDVKEVNFLVAPLSLQMLVENAIKHNVISEENPLTIEIRKDESMVWVSNTLQPKAILPDDSSGVGLDNIRKRYLFLANLPVMVKAKGDKFEVGLPLLTE